MRSQPAARPSLRLRIGRQPCAGLRLRLPASRQEGRRLHAGDDAAAEDRQDEAVRRRVRRDQAVRRLLRRLLPRLARIRRDERRPYGAALRPRGHHRGQATVACGDRRPDAGRPRPRHHDAAGRRRRAVGGCHALFPRDRPRHALPVLRASRRAEPGAKPCRRTAGGARQASTISSTGRRWPRSAASRSGT